MMCELVPLKHVRDFLKTTMTAVEEWKKDGRSSSSRRRSKAENEGRRKA